MVGVTPKYNFRFADDWVILTSTEHEAYRLKRMLTKYFKSRMKLELSQEKTLVTDLRTEGIHFLGFVVKAERKRKTPDPKTWTENLVGKPLPDMERLKEKIQKIADEVRVIGEITERSVQADLQLLPKQKHASPMRQTVREHCKRYTVISLRKDSIQL